MLIEAAWSYRFPARVSREQLLRQERLAAPIRAIAWKAQERLCLKYRKLSRAGKPITIVTTAIARQLADFVWAIALEVDTQQREESWSHQRKEADSYVILICIWSK